MATVRVTEGETRRSDIVVDGTYGGTSVKPMPVEDPQEVWFSMLEFILTLYFTIMCRSVNLKEMTTAPILYLLKVLMQLLIQLSNCKSCYLLQNQLFLVLYQSILTLMNPTSVILWTG